MNGISLPTNWKMIPFMNCLKKVKAKKKSSIPKRGYQEFGEFPVIDQGASFIAGWTDSSESVISDNLPVVIFGDHTRLFKYVFLTLMISHLHLGLMGHNFSIRTMKFCTPIFSITRF